MTPTTQLPPNPCQCTLCLGASPRDRFTERVHPHGCTFTCKDCGEEVQFGEGATATSIDEELLSHVCHPHRQAAENKRIAAEAVAAHYSRKPFAARILAAYYGKKRRTEQAAALTQSEIDARPHGWERQSQSTNAKLHKVLCREGQ